MYTEHFGLKKLPFENVPDPTFFFDQGDHARVRTRITESLRAGRGLTVVTGPIGAGKTTLSQMITADVSNGIKLIWLAEPPGSSTDLFLFVAQELGLKPLTTDRAFILRDIREALLKINSEGSKCLTIIDESHLMTDDMFNGIRILNNLEEGPLKLIQILLLGQEELMTAISRPEMEPFKQRIATLEIIGKMNSERLRNYVTHRIKVAGGQTAILADSGWEALDLAFGSEGTPRVINLLCDKSLNAAFEREKTVVDIHDVYEASKGMGLSKEIFHRIVTLNQQERDKQQASAAGGEPEARAAQPNRAGAPISRPAAAYMSKPPKPEKSLNAPVFFLILSIAAVTASVFFYCDRTGSSELISCIQELIGLL